MGGMINIGEGKKKLVPRLYPSVRPKHGALLKGTFLCDVIDGKTARRKVRNEEDLFFNMRFLDDWLDGRSQQAERTTRVSRFITCLQ